MYAEDIRTSVKKMTEDRDCDHPPSDHSASTSATMDSSPEERYRKIFHYNNDAVMIVDPETDSFLGVNPAACDLLGYSHEELLWRIDDAVATVESLGADRAYVIGGAGIYDLFQPVVDRMVLSRIPGEYDGDVYFPEWDANKWTVVDRTPYDDFILEEWVRERT